MSDSALVLFALKLAGALVSPLGVVMGLLLGGGIAMATGRGRLAKWLRFTALAVLWVSATPVFASWALSTLERQHPPVALAELPTADVAIVLGGAIGQPLPPRKELDLSSAADRVLHAARLYKAGKVRRVLVAAGNVPWLPAVKTEAELIAELLVTWGVPANDIEIAGQSRNTFENALEIVEMRRTRPFASALLVTSASHMPRALAVFRRAGLPVTPATTDVEVVDEPSSNPLRWLPDAGALAMTTTAVREWVGYLAYRLRGYL